MDNSSSRRELLDVIDQQKEKLNRSVVITNIFVTTDFMCNIYD